MEQSILTSTKKILGIAEEYTAYDLDVTTHINAAFSHLYQLGIGPTDGYQIEDSSNEWGEFTASSPILNLVKTFVYLWVQAKFDPPATSFALDARKEQLQEIEWRLYVLRDSEIAAEEVAP